MSYRAIYAYAWDVADRGVPDFAAEIARLGLDTVTLAGAYHAGKFLRPHGRNGKIYFPEDGTVYFRADAGRYGAVKPVLNSLLAERDVLRELTDSADLAVNAWMVLLHNSRLGEAHPEITVRNAFGDPYVYSLCPSAPPARDYAVALCRDVTDHYPVLGLSLETPGFLPYAHGYHHEFALVRSNRWLDNSLGLCFCEHCLRGGRAAGIDVGALRERIRSDVEAYLASDLDFPDDMAEAFWLADIRSDGELRRFIDWRMDVVTSLVAEIREVVRGDATVAVIPSVARPTSGAWYEGTDLAALAEVAGIVEACFYEPSAERVAADLFDLRRRIAGRGKLRGILRPAHPDLSGGRETVAAAKCLADAGLDGIAFYNWGHWRRSGLRHVADALAAIAVTG